MKLMLGIDGEPSLLVNVNNNFDRNDFDFEVINGYWKGHFYNGYITIKGCPGGDETSLVKREIICDNQDRLRGEYEEVFYNFDNVNYVAPLPKPVPDDFDDYDDDIPF